MQAHNIICETTGITANGKCMYIVIAMLCNNEPNFSTGTTVSAKALTSGLLG